MATATEVIAKRPVTKRSVTKRPVTQRPLTKRPATKRLVTKRPVTKRPATKRPATKRIATMTKSTSSPDNMKAAAINHQGPVKAHTRAKHVHGGDAWTSSATLDHPAAMTHHFLLDTATPSIQPLTPEASEMIVNSSAHAHVSTYPEWEPGPGQRTLDTIIQHMSTVATLGYAASTIKQIGTGAKQAFTYAYDTVRRPNIQAIRDHFDGLKKITLSAWTSLPDFLQRAAVNKVSKMLLVLLMFTSVSYMARMAVIRYYRDITPDGSSQYDIKASPQTLAAIHRAQGQTGISASEKQALTILEATANRGAIPDGLDVTKEDLKRACRIKGLAISGTNDDLAARIVDSMESDLLHGTLVPQSQVSPRPSRRKSRNL